RAMPTHPLLRSGSLHASQISGGQELSSYPERCILSVERRTIPGETPESVEAQIQTLLAGLTADDPAFQDSVRTTVVREPFEVAPDTPLVALVQRQAETLLQNPVSLYGETFWMDSTILA